MAAYTSRLTRVNPEKITQDSLHEAAEYFVAKLLPVIPRSLRKGKHMRDYIKIEVSDEEITVYFENTAFYWRFIENGTVKITATHFVEGTWQQQKEKIEDIMTQKLMNELEG